MDDNLRQGRINHARLVEQARQRAKLARETIQLATYSPREHAPGEKSYVTPEESIRALGLLRNHERLATELVYKMIDGKPAYEAAKEAANAGINRYAIREMISRSQRIIEEIRHLDRPVLSPRNNGYAKSFGPLDLVKAEKPPAGFTEFGSKVPGGARKPDGSGGYEYWYPGQGTSSKPHADEGHEHHEAHRKDLERQLAEARAKSKPSPEVHAKFMELAKRAEENGIRVTGKHPNGSHTIEDMQRFEKRLDRAIARRKAAEAESAAADSSSPPTGEKDDTGVAAEGDNRPVGQTPGDIYDGLSPREQVREIRQNAAAFGDFIADMKKLGLETDALEAAHKRLDTVLKKIGADSDDPVVKPSERETLKQLAGALRWMVFGMLTGFLAGGGHAGIAGLAAGSSKAMIDQKSIRQTHKEALQRFVNHKEMGEASRQLLAEFEKRGAKDEQVETDEDGDAPAEAPQQAQPEDRPHFGDNASETEKPAEKPDETPKQEAGPNRAQRRAAAKEERRKPKQGKDPAKQRAERKRRRKQAAASRRRNRAKKSLFIDIETGEPVLASPLDLMKADSYRVPAGARGNARKVLEWKKKYGSEVKGMTSVGWARARQLASQATIGIDTVKRMSAFNRHRQNAKVDPKFASEPWKDRGYVAWLGWGGTTGVDWARRITGALDKGFSPEDVHDLAEAAGVEWDDNPEFMEVCENLVGKRHLDDMNERELRIVADNISKAEDLAVSRKIRFLMEREGKPQDQAVAIALDMQRRGELGKADAKKTPAEPHERKKGSKRNKPGSAATGSGGVTLSAATIETLRNKVKEHNESSEKKVTLGKLKAVYRRGSGAFSTSHHPNANRHSWSMGRVNSFLKRVKGSGGHPQDDDLISKAGGPFIGPRGGKWADPDHTIPYKPTSGAKPSGKKEEPAKPKRGAPASQLPEDVQARLKELGVGKLPAADIPAEHIHVRLDGDPHETAVIKWRDAKGKLQSGYTPEFHKRNAEKKWARVMGFMTGFKKTKSNIHKALSSSEPGSREHQAALVSAIITHTGLRPGSAASAKHGHYGVSTLTPAHITIDGNKVSFEFVGKQGKTNTATIRNGAIAQALTPYMKGGNRRNQPMFGSTVVADARKTLRSASGGDMKLKDLRTIKATQKAMQMLDEVVTPPPLTGNPAKDKRLLAKAMLEASVAVADLINNTPAVARSSYVHPQVFRKWAIDRAGADPKLFEEV